MPEEIKKTTNLKKLVKLAHNNAYFFKDPDSRAFAKIKKGEHREELYPLKSSSFEDWLSAINFKVFEEVATSKLKSDATEYLEGETNLPGETTIKVAVAATVLLSIFVHGLTALPGISRYATAIAPLDNNAPEHEPTGPGGKNAGAG